MPNAADALLGFAQTVADTVARAGLSGGSADRSRAPAALPALVATLTPGVAGLKQRLAALDDGAKRSLIADVGARARAEGIAASRPVVMAVAAALVSPRLRDAPADLIALYLLLWLLDQAIIAQYSAEHLPFDLKDPPADYWYARTDTAGTHQFFTGGNYLIETIPAISDEQYYNAEIYNSTQTEQQPKNVIVNLFPVDDPKDLPHFLYDLFLNVPYVPANGLAFSARVKAGNLNGGSRGWGFWNTDALPLSMQVAWFIQFQGEAKHGVQPIYPNGFYAITQNGLSGPEPSCIKLADLDEEWHDYRIEITAQAVEYFIDGSSVAKVPDAKYIPSAPMAFHYWVDNAMFGFNDQGLLLHILQTTTAPRSNTIKDLRIRSLPAGARASA
jgi:hypothetical protein